MVELWISVFQFSNPCCCDVCCFHKWDFLSCIVFKFFFSSMFCCLFSICALEFFQFFLSCLSSTFYILFVLQVQTIHNSRTTIRLQINYSMSSRYLFIVINSTWRSIRWRLIYLCFQWLILLYIISECKHWLSLSSINVYFNLIFLNLWWNTLLLMLEMIFRMVDFVYYETLSLSVSFIYVTFMIVMGVLWQIM